MVRNRTCPIRRTRRETYILYILLPIAYKSMKIDLPKRFRHGVEHHSDHCFCRSNLVLQDPFSCHTDSAVTIQAKVDKPERYGHEGNFTGSGKRR